MEKKDWIFLGLITLFIALICVIIKLSVAADQINTGFYLSLFGTAITLIALFFSIFQQIQIKTKSKQIEERTNNFENTLRNNLYSWNINRAINLTDKLHDCVRESKKEYSFFLVKEIQSILADCKAVNTAYYHSELTKCLQCVDKKAISKISLDQIIADCSQKCQHELAEGIKENTGKLSIVMAALETFPEKFKKKEIGIVNKRVTEVRDYLNNIKPDPITLSKAS